MERSTLWTIGGILSLIVGFLCLLNPFAGSVAVTFVAGWAFSLLGLLQILAVIVTPGVGNKVLLGILGAVTSYLGWTILANPLEGMLSLTLAAGLLILAGGIMRLVLAFGFRGRTSFWALILSAVVSIILGALILANFPASALTLLGLFLGIELIFVGAWLLSLASITRHFEPVTAAG